MWLLVALAQIAPPAPLPCDAWADLAITDVQVVNVLTGRVEPHSTIVIANGRICAVAADARARIPEGTQVIDGRGRYLIPGLWDLHAQSTRGADLRRLVGFGITSVPAEHADSQQLEEWYRVMSDPYALTPTIYVSTEARTAANGRVLRLDAGSDLHDALALLVDNGLPNVDALRAATMGAARAANVADRVGSIAVGYEASLLLLEGNPL
jgi:N-acetylglucosamine-6-phosphate deacetylase